MNSMPHFFKLCTREKIEDNFGLQKERLCPWTKRA